LHGANVTAQSPWRIDDDTATLSSANLSGELDLTKPWTGLHRLAYAGTSCVGLKLLSVASQPGTNAETILDRYVRGGDLVVRYGPTEQRPVSLQLDWRTFFDETISGVDLNISMQTDLLDSDPTLRVVSAIAASDVILLGSPASILVRPRNIPVSILVAAHPSDCEEDEIASEENDTSVIAFQIFGAGLEKGVIRRARLRTALLPREDDEEIARAWYANFLSAELPLTT
jgi:hypothetical protein